MIKIHLKYSISDFFLNLVHARARAQGGVFRCMQVSSRPLLGGNFEILNYGSATMVVIVSVG
jgi:hypothetical protein